ncbi:MAG TPA: ASCH domain-containing protein [Candidatus Paceibacterota bacterium]|jgi:ASC-1-like (ASCH) protein|nr:ASCH domain-containing protein [Candidatus Paceibacterota bacterium]
MNKEWILRFRVVDKDNFLEIKNGLKTVETRAATPKYREVKVGDMLVIVCGEERLEKKVKRVLTFTSIGSMVKRIPYKKIMPSVSSLSELRKIYYSYQGYKEKLKKHGVIAFNI